MRILQVVLAPRLSGAEVLAKGVAIGHQQGGHDVCITSLMPEHDDFEHISAELRANNVLCLFPQRSLGKVGRLLFLHRAIRRFKPDIIFAHATIPALYVRALPTRVPIVWVMHSGANDFANNALLFAERLLSGRAKAVIGVSQKNIDDYVKEVGSHPSMIVVPNGVDISRFTQTSEPLTSTGIRQIVQIGRYIPEKNQLQTVQAFARVAAVDPDVRLLLCGVIENLAYHAAIVKLVDELGLERPREDNRAAVQCGRNPARVARVRDALEFRGAQHRLSRSARVRYSGGRERNPVVCFCRYFPRRRAARYQRRRCLRPRIARCVVAAARDTSVERTDAAEYG